MLLHEASTNLFRRSPDEHFDSFDAIHARCQEAMLSGVEIPSDPKKTYFVPRGQGISVVLGNDQEVRPTHFCLGQIATACRIPVPVLERVSRETGAKALNELFPRDQSERMALVENGTLRSLTSTSYSRLWDFEMLQEVDRWLLPRGFIPAVPTLAGTDGVNIFGNRKPALFRGDRDSFCFFYADGQRQAEELGGLRRGLLCWNSEVGARAFGWSTFYFREMCSNFLIWDVRDHRERRAIHKGGLQDAFRDFRGELIEISGEIEAHTLDVFAKAAETPFVGDGSPTKENQELAVERLQKQFRVPEKTGTKIVEASLLPENPGDLSVWGIVNGATSLAKEGSYAAEMVDLASVGGKLLAV